MPQIPVTFTFHSGIRRAIFKNVRLSGSWDAAGLFSPEWTQVPMVASQDWTGCAAFSATVNLDDSQIGNPFQWGVFADLPGAPHSWVIVTETQDADTIVKQRSYVLDAAGTPADYWFVTGRRFGAQQYTPPGAAAAGISFSVWSPYAQAVAVVFGLVPAAPTDPNGYIDDNGGGIDPAAPVIVLVKDVKTNIWSVDPTTTAGLSDFSAYMNRPYMYRIVNEQGVTTYRVDIFSRNQIGHGNVDPGGTPYTGTYQGLDGIVSCSVVSNPDLVTSNFADTGLAKSSLIPATQFWANEFTAGQPLPQSIDDLIIYELHVGSLGYPILNASGTLTDAMAFVASLVDLGVNAVELLPLLESDGNQQWGYGTSLFFCLQTSQGGANQLKHFIRACHQAGIAVIMDVVYNHFPTSGAERSEWGYDSNPADAPDHNTWTWWEGKPADYPEDPPGDPEGGYLDNDSTGYCPCYWQENVRQMFTSSAAALFDDFHIDGIRVDLTDAMHNNNRLHGGNHAAVAAANQFGAKLLRELSRTVLAVNPAAFLIAEDYTGWSAMTQPVDQGQGIGFAAVWYMDFYHNLIGDGDYGGGYAALLKNAGSGMPGPLSMDAFAGALLATQYNKVAYHESHDEAGNDHNTERTIVTAVNGAALWGATRTYAEARCRFAFGMAAMSAGTVMFFMGEEIGAANPFTVGSFAANKEDLIGERTGNGRFLYAFYKALIRFVLGSPAARSLSLDVIYLHNDNRVIAFTRTSSGQQLLVIASLNDAPFAHGYVIGTDFNRLPAGGWQEVFNSDATVYGGNNIGNDGATLQVANGTISAVVPANGFVIFEKVS